CVVRDDCNHLSCRRERNFHSFDGIKTGGDIDLQGFLGIRDDVPRGYKQIRMTVDIDADASPEELEEIVKLGPTYSPVYDTVTRPVPVSVQLKK
ncbi:MAG: OsmC family protein, partial [Desulforhopalus sp.]